MQSQVQAVSILGIGSYLPPNVVSDCEREKIVDTSNEWKRDRTGQGAAAATAFVLDEALRTERIKPESHSVIVAFGGGLTWGSLCLRWNKLPTL